MIKRLLFQLLVGSMIFSVAVVNAAPVSDIAKVQNIVDGQFRDYITDLETLVNIDSGTGNTEGSALIADILKAKLEGLGGSVEYRTNDKGTHVISRFKGDGKLRLLFLAHTDTVFDKGEAAKRPFRLDEQTKFVYGPGAGDDKAIVVQTLYLMKTLNEIGFHNYGEIILYYSAEEETGSDFSTQLIAELSQQADVCFENQIIP